MLTRLEILAAILAILGLYIAWDHYHSLYVGETRGEAKVVTADTKAANKQAAKVDAQVAAAIPEVKREAEVLHETMAKPVTDAPPARLCAPAKPSNPREVLPAASTGPVANGAPAGGEAPTRDIGTAVVTVGRDSDAQVVALQDYISRVCQAH